MVNLSDFDRMAEPTLDELIGLDELEISELIGQRYAEIIGQNLEIVESLEESEEFSHLTPELVEIINLMKDEVCVLVRINRGEITAISTKVIQKVLKGLERNFDQVIKPVKLSISKNSDEQALEDDFDDEMFGDEGNGQMQEV